MSLSILSNPSLSTVRYTATRARCSLATADAGAQSGAQITGVAAAVKRMVEELTRSAPQSSSASGLGSSAYAREIAWFLSVGSTRGRLVV